MNPSGVLPGPLQIVDDENDRSFAGGDRAQYLDRVLLGPHLCRQRVPGVRGDVQQRGEFRQYGYKLARVGAARPEDAVPHVGEFVLRFRQQQPAEAAKCLPYAVKLVIAAVLVELAHHEPAVVGRHHRP